MCYGYTAKWYGRSGFAVWCLPAPLRSGPAQKKAGLPSSPPNARGPVPLSTFYPRSTWGGFEVPFGRSLPTGRDRPQVHFPESATEKPGRHDEPYNFFAIRVAHQGRIAGTFPSIQFKPTRCCEFGQIYLCLNRSSSSSDINYRPENTIKTAFLRIRFFLSFQHDRRTIRSGHFFRKVVSSRYV